MPFSKSLLLVLVFFLAPFCANAAAISEPVRPNCPEALGKLAPPNRSTPTLDRFGRDLTEMARKGQLDPVIGRETQAHRILQILLRRSKNNPVILGEAGVGKTAIVEGLAQLIASGDVPELLRGKRVVALDLGSLVAGTKYRGELEARVKQILQEVSRCKNTILFIDELHTLVGAGRAEGGTNISDILKPVLARGELQVIGATTLDEYRKSIEKDAALERRFQPVIVNPPTPEQTVDIAKGLRERLEAHHHVRITDNALKLAVELSNRYITGRQLPDKAIDVIDEAGSRVVLKAAAPPSAELAGLNEQITRLTQEKQNAVADRDYVKASRLLEQVRKLEKDREALYQRARQRASSPEGVVDEETVREVVSDMTGVALGKLDTDESHRLLEMEKEMHQNVIGQKEAITRIARAVRKQRAGLKDPKRPTGSFLFAGPTGVGKTLIAKELARFLFGDEKALIQLDMSEYMEKASVSRLIGAPPGYVGYEEGGQLTEQVRRRPYAVVLLDEIEKAHPDVWNTLLQVMEEGHLTDGSGRVVDFKNVILIMTSNLGADVTRRDQRGFSRQDEAVAYDEVRSRLQTELEGTFRPEFLNRLDEIVPFFPLTKQETLKVIDLELAKVAKLLSEKHLRLLVTDEAKELLRESNENSEYGGRALRRLVDHEIKDALAERILRGDFEGKDEIVVGVEASNGGKRLTFDGRAGSQI